MKMSNINYTYIGGGYYGASPYQISNIIDRKEAETRARTIHDNFGVRPESLDEYRQQNGGSKIINGLLLGIGCAIGAGIIAALVLPSLLPTALVGFTAASIGLVAGVIAGNIPVAIQEKKIMTGYNSYLDNVSAKARAESKNPSIAGPAEDGISGKSYVDALNAEKVSSPQGPER